MGIRDFFATPLGKVIGCGFPLIVLVVLVVSTNDGIGSAALEADSSQRYYICTETGKSFRREMDLNTKPPVMSPYSGKATGVEAELCYWTADGRVKSHPTPVLLNAKIGKPEPTFCPDCNRLVVGLNPYPREGAKPPPTREEYAARRRSQSK